MGSSAYLQHWTTENSFWVSGFRYPSATSKLKHVPFFTHPRTMDLHSNVIHLAHKILQLLAWSPCWPAAQVLMPLDNKAVNETDALDFIVWFFIVITVKKMQGLLSDCCCRVDPARIHLESGRASVWGWVRKPTFFFLSSVAAGFGIRHAGDSSLHALWGEPPPIEATL